MSKSKDVPSTRSRRRQLVGGVPEKVSFCLPSPSAEPPSSPLSTNPRSLLLTHRLPALTGGCLSDPAHFEMSQVLLLKARVSSAALGMGLEQKFPHIASSYRGNSAKKRGFGLWSFSRGAAVETFWVYVAQIFIH